MTISRKSDTIDNIEELNKSPAIKKKTSKNTIQLYRELLRIENIENLWLYPPVNRPIKIRLILSADANNVRIQLSIVNVSRMRAFRPSNPSLFCLERPLLESLFYFGTSSIRDWTERLWKSKSNKST